jgi:hypothetical protein
MVISDSAKEYICLNRQYAKPLLALLDPSYKGWIFYENGNTIGRRDVLGITSDIYQGDAAGDASAVLKELVSIGVLTYKEDSQNNRRIALAGELIEIHSECFFDPDLQKRKELSDFLATI